MAEFHCRLAAPSGEIVERSFVAEDERELRRDLESKDYLVLDLRRQSALLQSLIHTFRIRPRISSREFLFFNQELSALLRAGLPILSSLDILLEKRENAAFRKALADIRERVKSGDALSDSFAAQGDLFPKLYAASLASGERSGELPAVLGRFIAYMKKIIGIRRKVTAALIYPAILMVMSVGLVALLVFYIIPKFNSFLQDFQVELPLITVVLVNGATFASEHWKTILAAVTAGILGLMAWNRSDAGRLLMDRVKLRLPLVGPIVHDYSQNRFTRTLGTLVAGGIPLVSSLELAARAVGNSVYEEKLLQVAQKVREGQSLWESLEATGLISEMAIEMIKVGESTGSLEEMLDNASEFVDEEIDHRLTRVISLMEPLMLVFMALVVGAMLLAIYLPLIRAYGQAHV